MAGFQALVDRDTASLIAQVERRMAANPGFRNRLWAMIQRYKAVDGKPSWTAGLDYLDETLKSPRLRALLEEPKLRVAARLADAD